MTDMTVFNTDEATRYCGRGDCDAIADRVVYPGPRFRCADHAPLPPGVEALLTNEELEARIADLRPHAHRFTPEAAELKTLVEEQAGRELDGVYAHETCHYCGESGTPENPVIDSIVEPPTWAGPVEPRRVHESCASAWARDLVR